MKTLKIMLTPPPEWADIPSLIELEAQFRKAQPMRAIFEDLVPGELLRKAAPLMAQKYYPLLLKIALSGKEPLLYKGGLLAAAYKQKGKQSECESYRSLMVSSGIAKAFHALYRKELVRPLRAYALPLQIGGLPGMSISHASQALLAFTYAMRQQGLNVAILFLDVQQAFYRLLRQHMLEYADERSLRSLFTALQLPEETYDKFCALVCQDSALSQAAVGEHLRAMIAEFFRTTWFIVPGSTDITHTRRGSRPGDSLADICYTFALSKILKPLINLAECQAGVDLRWSGSREPFAHSMHTPLGPVCPIWADDLAIAFAHPDPDGVLLEVQKVVGGLFDVLIPAGMQPNTKAQKTEVLVDLRGKGKQNCLRRLMQQDMNLTIETKWNAPRLRVVDAYKHLGTWITTGGRLLLDMRTKFAHAHTLVTKYKGPIFANKSFPLCKKIELFNALVLSTIVFNTAAWHVLSTIETRHFTCGILKLYRRLAQLHFGSIAFHWTTETTCARLQLPSPAMLLISARLRYLQQLVQNGPDQLWGILQLDGTWWQLIESDLEWFRETLPDYTPEPTLQEWTDLSAHLQKPGQGWKAAIKRAVRLRVAYATMHWKWREWHKRILDTLIEFDLYTPSTADSMKGQHICMPCKKRFNRAAAWAVHAFKCHGRVKHARTVAQGTLCVACLKQYASTVSLVNHLAYSTQCLMHFRALNEEINVSPGLNSRQELKGRRPLHLPYLQAQGPLREPMPVIQHREPDYITCSLAWTQAWEKGVDLPPEQKLQWMLTCTAQLVVPFESLAHHLSCWIVESAMQEETTVDLFAVGHRLLHSLKMETFVGKGESPTGGHADHDVFDIFATWEFEKRPSMSLSGRIFYRPVVVAHLFSGRRREGDLQSHLEAWKGILEGARILSIDIIFHPTLGDMLNSETQALFRRAIAEGVLHALVCGPPCETWSVARHRDDQGPRPLRSAELPGGLPGLRPKEIKQLSIGNELLGVAAVLFLDCLVHGVFMLLEHPEEPWTKEEAASIWRLDVIKILASFANCSMAHVLQGHFGALSAKPTRFLLANSTPDYDEIFLSHRTSSFPPSRASIGKNPDGTWKTACLKEYPNALCRAIAHVIEVSLSCNIFREPASDTEWFHEAVEKLCKDFNLEANMGPDYAG